MSCLKFTSLDVTSFLPGQPLKKGFKKIMFIQALKKLCSCLDLNLWWTVEVFRFFIESFISSYSCNALFTETNSSWLTYELIKALEIRTSMVFTLVFAYNTLLSCFFFFFLIIDLYFLFTAIIEKILNHTAKLALPVEIPTEEAKKSRIWNRSSNHRSQKQKKQIVQYYLTLKTLGDQFNQPHPPSPPLSPPPIPSVSFSPKCIF